VKKLSENTTDLLQEIKTEAAELPQNKRRDFMLNGLKLTAGTALATAVGKVVAGQENLPPNVPTWQKSLGRGVVSVPYGQPSKHEANLIRRTVEWLTADKIASISMSPLHKMKGIITPSGLHFERYHGGVPEVNPDDHRIMINGMVDRPLLLTMDELMSFPSESHIHFLECPANGGMEWRGAQMEALQFTHGMLSGSEWTGVKLSTILQEAGIKPGAKWVLAEGADAAGMTRSIPLDKALDDTLVVFAQNGEMLRPEQGYPVRLFTPGWEGNTSVKWLRRLEVGDMPWAQREETSKYTDLLADGKARKHSFVQEVNSVITSPCPENPIKRRGLLQLEGLAWSGHGKVKRVDISLDGGVSWQTARLKGLVLSKSLTRFGMEINWQGEPLLLQSRAVDETGYVQPTLSQLREVRGTNSIYHKNSIHTWQVQTDGAVNNVQLG
jgi:sulfane dehydrogenase subunit SoxC|tara:strand:+ start:2315 stop:3634 length:1320 start_codon:yes stop_codon:yes gene_type:complete